MGVGIGKHRTDVINKTVDGGVINIGSKGHAPVLHEQKQDSQYTVKKAGQVKGFYNTNNFFFAVEDLNDPIP